jgi:hypothetical protein
MEARTYKIGAAMPGLLLGLLPASLALLSRNGWLLIYGVLFTWTAGGDALILWLLRNVEPGARVEDHPTKVGCYVLSEHPE